MICVPNLWWWTVLLIAVAIALALEIAFAVKCRKLRYYLGALILLYALVLLAWVVFFNGSQYYLVRTGLFTAVLITALLSLHISDLISDEKK